MQLSTHSASFVTPQNREKTSSTPKRTKTHRRSLPLSNAKTTVDDSRQDDDVPFLLSVVFSEAEARDDALSSILSSPIEEIEAMRQSREQLVLSLVDLNGGAGRGASDAHAAALLLNFSAGSGDSLDASASKKYRRHPSVSFVPSVVTAVREIPSHRSLTAEEKNRLYRSMSTVQRDAEKSKVECEFEGSYHCCDNALEENVFFRNHLGELVHPAHYVSYTREELANLPGFVSVPGFSSFTDYMKYMVQYALFLDKAKQNSLFRSQHP